jgi:GT2 family glycosyltransferase
LRIVGEEAAWGRFDVRFDHGSPLVHAIARLITLRSRMTRGATGDQAMFVRRDVYESVGGFREPELFEDVDLSRRLKRRGRMGIPCRPVVTSARRWRRHGAVRTSLRMWTLKLLYLAGVPAAKLARFYPDAR